jgi:hypothetical protein
MLSLKSLIIAGAVAISLFVAPVAPAMASAKGAASSKAKTTLVVHKKSHRALAKKATKTKVKAKKAHKVVAAKTHNKAASR